LNFLAFQKAFGQWPVVQVAEVEKTFSGFDRNALTRWQRSGLPKWHRYAVFERGCYFSKKS